MHAVDISNYTDPLTPGALAAWQANDYGLVIVQAVAPPLGYPAGQTRTQVQACLNAGLTVDAYIWLWFDLDIEDIHHKLALLDGQPIRRLWLDVEDQAASKYDTPTCNAKVQAALDLCGTYPVTGGKPTGIYTGRWFWVNPNFMANTTVFSDRDLWDSDYNGIETTDGFVPYGGWQARAIKQYAGTSTLAGIGGVDLNVLSTQEAADLAQPTVDDAAWQARKDEIVGLAGELQTVAEQIKTAALRRGGPVRNDVLPLSEAVRARATQILGS